MKGFKVYLMDGDREIMKVGSINQSVMLEKQYDVINGLTKEWVQTWNWMCMGAGKQRRGRGNFRTIEDAKKAFLKACRWKADNLKFVEIQEKVAA